jgi:hypothetical protein
MEAGNLVIKKITVDNGPSLKRFRPRSRGMVSHILKRTSHITVVVSDETAAPSKKQRAISEESPKKLATKDKNIVDKAEMKEELVKESK